ncbi:hypothetical protein J6590_058853 [Homalodisca vitripennis]|nr:hypothetical protein J6590_058853 [Homalodisca vitripennis]
MQNGNFKLYAGYNESLLEIFSKSGFIDVARTLDPLEALVPSLPMLFLFMGMVGTHITAPCPTRESADCRCGLGSVTVRPHTSVCSPSATISLFVLEHVSFEFEVTDT